jgi:phosphatidylglycerophosphate synthase
MRDRRELDSCGCQCAGHFREQQGRVLPMLDGVSRRLLEAPLDRVAAAVDRPWVTPDRISLLGLGLGLAGAVSAALAEWPTALVLWLASRLADGLDGPLARRRHRRGAGGTSGDAGGFLDVAADFVVYGAFVVGVGVGVDGSLLPFLAVLLTYYVNGSAFLAFSSLAERAGEQIDDGRSLSFIGGLAEGTETVVVHALWCLVPFWAEPIAWGWAGVVGISATQRVVGGYRTLRSPSPTAR